MFLLILVAIVSAVLITGGRKTLWPLFYLLGVLLALPGFLFASACLVMQRATSHGNLFEFFDTILSFIVAMLPWGATVMVVCLLILLAAGFGTRWRRPAATVVSALVLGSAAVMHWVAGLPKEADQWWFFVPGGLSMLIAGGLFITAKRTSRKCEIASNPQDQKTSTTMSKSLILSIMVSLAAAPLQTRADVPVPPPKQAPSFEQSLREVRTDLRVGEAGFGGDGAPVLEKAIAAAHYVLIGEDHFTREIPQFTSVVCDLMAAQGLSALATEASPSAAEFVGASLDQPDRKARLAELLKKYPDSVAFLNSAQENDLAAHAARVAHAAGFQLWGLDQEFLGSAGWLLDRILATRPGPGATAALTRLREEEKRDAAQAQESGDPSKVFLLVAADAALAEAGNLLKHEGNTEANSLFDALTESRAIYLANAAGSQDANARRARLLKRNFRERLEAAVAAGHKGAVLVKLGAWHLYKGFNPLHQRDLGNYLAELADKEGSASLHICVLGARGGHRLYGGYARPLRDEPFVLDQDTDFAWIKPALDNQVPGAWTLYDLRRLRARKLGPVDPAMSRLIDGYDLLVIIPEVTPADPIP